MADYFETAARRNASTANPYGYGGWTQTQPVVTPQTSVTNNFVWVQGEMAAKSYPVAPGLSLMMMDSESPVLYIKTVDYVGKPQPLEVFDLVKRETKSADAQSQEVDMSQYVKTADLEALVAAQVKSALEKALA